MTGECFCLCRPHAEHLGPRVQQQVEEVLPAEAALLHGLCKFMDNLRQFKIHPCGLTLSIQYSTLDVIVSPLRRQERKLMSLVYSQFDSFAFKVLLFYLFIVFVGVLLSWTDAAGRWQVWWSYQISPGSREVYVCFEICCISELHGEYTLSKPSDRSTVHTTTIGRRGRGGGGPHITRSLRRNPNKFVWFPNFVMKPCMRNTLICWEKQGIEKKNMGERIRICRQQRLSVFQRAPWNDPICSLILIEHCGGQANADLTPIVGILSVISKNCYLDLENQG